VKRKRGISVGDRSPSFTITFVSALFHMTINIRRNSLFQKKSFRFFPIDQQLIPPLPETLKKQASQNAAEYDNLATKYNAATGQNSDKRRD